MQNPVSGPAPTTLEQKYIRYYRTNLLNSLQTAYNLVREHGEVKKLIQKRNYDKYTSKPHYVVGDLVWVRIPNPQIDNATITQKLRPKYHGPCRLTEQLSPTTFMVTRITDNVNLGATNVDRMKYYYEPQVDETLPSSNASSHLSNTMRRVSSRLRRPLIRY